MPAVVILVEAAEIVNGILATGNCVGARPESFLLEDNVGRKGVLFVPGGTTPRAARPIVKPSTVVGWWWWW